MTMPQSGVNLVSDTTLTAGALVVPIWVYQISVVAGAVTAVLGMLLVAVRLITAIRDWGNRKEAQE